MLTTYQLFLICVKLIKTVYNKGQRDYFLVPRLIKTKRKGQEKTAITL